MKGDIALERGIYRRLVDSMGAIRTEAWKRAVETRDIVGLCRRCPGLMQAIPTSTNDRIEWHGAECNSCGYEVVIPSPAFAPGGSLMHRSSRHDEMAFGSWDKRVDYLTKMKKLGKAEAA